MNKIKLRVIHIHTDYKFVENSSFFDGDLFDNSIIIIQNQKPYTGPFKDKALLLSTSFSDINKIIAFCKKADLVVLYDLNKIKCSIALALPKNIKIAWRFFGYELYWRRLDKFLSEKSLQFFPKKQNTFLLQFVEPFRNLQCILKYGGTSKNLFYKAINRINYMLVLSKEEYDFLKGYWSSLPEFIKLPHSHFKQDFKFPNFELKTNQKKPIIVLGNNRSAYNNHLDLIEIIDTNQNKVNYNFTILFNYGIQDEYARTVKKTIEGKPYYTLINDFIPPEEFESFYDRITALVINSFRQMAGANIFMALQNGVKVYLNEKNIFMQWLRNEGFKVFTIADFENDLTNNNIKVDQSLAEFNFNKLVEFSKKYTNEDFQKIIHNKISIKLH